MRNRMKDVSIFAGKYSALDKKLFSELISRFCLSFLLFIPLLAFSQNFEVENDIISISGLTNTTISIKGRSELRITGIGDPIPGCVINLETDDSWLIFTEVKPSDLVSTLLSRLRIRGLNAILNNNVRVAQYAQGSAVIPHSSDFAPLEVFNGRFFTGNSVRLKCYIGYNAASLGSIAGAIKSFKLKRGYFATFAENENGSGFSQCYIAQDGDLEIGVLPARLENSVKFIRIFPWRWVSKKGIAGNIESGLNVHWLYNWNIDRNSSADWEYVPIKQNRWWPSLDQNWQSRGATHLLGYNEPDRPDQANMSVSDAISSWNELLSTGLRVGAPAVSDGGLSWLYSFIDQADAAGLRVDFVPVHYYRCYGNLADAAGIAQQFYNFLKGVYDRVKRPLWVTEWNNGANWTSCADPTFSQQQAAVAAILNMLDNAPFVERYAIFNWVEDVRRVKWDDGSLTAAGETYRDQKSPLSYRQELPALDTNSSARYDFERNVYDVLGNGNNGIVVGTPAFVGGKVGLAIVFDGENDYIQVPPQLGGGSGFTFAGWVLWNGGANWQRIFDFGFDTTKYFYLTPKSGGNTLRFAINNGNGEQQINAPPLTAGVWTHLAITIGGNTGKLFINGFPVASNTSLTIRPSDVERKYNYLGKSQFPVDPLFNGRFDDFRFYDYALADSEIAAIANSRPPVFISSIITGPDAVPNKNYKATIATTAYGGAGALTFTKMQGPAWLTVFSNGGLTGTPKFSDSGPNRFIIKVTDSNGLYSTATLTIAVNPIETAMISASQDDAEEYESGTVNLTSTDLELVNDSATGAGNQIVGLRFKDITIPHGAIIQEATIQFTADESQNEPTTLNIFAEASDNAAPFSASSRNISTRPKTYLNVVWKPVPWNAGESNINQSTPNLAGIVQEVISRPGWASGNAIAFIISGTGHRTADSFEKSGGSPALLTIKYTSPTPIYSAASTIMSSANDAEESSSGAVNLTSTDLELINDSASGAGNQTVGLRFENLGVPAGAIISSAYIQFTADETQTELTGLIIRAEATDNADLFKTNAFNISSRNLTDASVRWNPPPWTKVGEKGDPQKTPDLSLIIKEIINRPGWKAGNAIAFIINGAGHRTADSFDKVGGSPPILYVNYYLETLAGSYERWASTNNELSNPLADPDGDGYNNFLEYALGINPLVSNSSATLLTLKSNNIVFTYTRATAALDVNYQVEWSDNLRTAEWSNIGISESIISDDGSIRTIQTTIPTGNIGNKFVRLKVIKKY
ncbi:MAG: glycosyl hydrolase [Verrucomicrobiia bacterium]